MTSSPRFVDILAASDRIAEVASRCPVMTCRSINELSGADIYFKAENFQKTGSFKFRGASNAVRSLSQADLNRGVATHSSGNHAQALARAARECGTTAYIAMPDNAPGVKKKAVLSYGAKITECGPSLVAREEALSGILKETGAYFIHPYDNPAVISGQGTSALELLKEVPGLDMIVAPVGGGGLLSGTAIAAAGMGRRAAVFGAEPELAQDAYQSLLKGRRMPPLPPLTAADGLRTALSDLTFDIIRRDVREILLASEPEILAAMKLLWERAKLLVEPSSAVALAPVLKDRERFFGKKIGIILSGGNVELSRINKYF